MAICEYLLLMSNLSTLTSTLREQLQQLHKPRKISTGDTTDARKQATLQVKLTLLRLRAALRETREVQHAAATAAEVKAQEIPKEYVRKVISEYHRAQLEAEVARLKNATFPELTLALETMEREVSDEQLLDVLAEELGRREALQQDLGKLQNERNSLDVEIAKNHDLNKKFLHKIAALDEWIKGVQGLVAGEANDQAVNEATELPAILRLLWERLQSSNLVAEISGQEISVKVDADINLTFKADNEEVTAVGNAFVCDSLSRRFESDWVTKFVIRPSEILEAAKNAAHTFRELRRERDILLKNPEKVSDGKTFKYSAQAVGEVGLKLKLVKIGDEKNFAEITTHEIFPSLFILKSLQGRAAASAGETVDPTLTAICEEEISESASLTQIFSAVSNKLGL
jgi:hypothetical protein